MTKPMKITHEIATKVFQVVDAPLADKQELCKAIDAAFDRATDKENA